jgi:hypothetical protein
VGSAAASDPLADDNVLKSVQGATFYLAEVDPVEDARTIEVLDPNGNAVTFDDESVEGFTPPYSGSRHVLDVSGTSRQPANRSSTFNINERRMQLIVQLPSIDASVNGRRTWWKLRYTFPTTDSRSHSIGPTFRGWAAPAGAAHP